ncbi:MAG: hypothetical protein ACREQB_03225 [Candidatus Binataceae bacterium]
MARVTRQISAAWTREAILVVDGAAPSRHFWSRWMDRALAPHEAEMSAPHTPTPANDIEPAGAADDAQSDGARSPVQPALRFD